MGWAAGCLHVQGEDPAVGMPQEKEKWRPEPWGRTWGLGISEKPYKHEGRHRKVRWDRGLTKHIWFSQ